MFICNPLYAYQNEKRRVCVAKKRTTLINYIQQNQQIEEMRYLGQLFVSFQFYQVYIFNMRCTIEKARV